MSTYSDYTVDAVANAWTEVGTSAANAQVIATHAAEANRHHAVFSCDASYSSSTGVGVLQVFFGGAVIGSKDIFGAGKIDFSLKGIENPTPNQAISAVLSAGGVGLVGVITLSGFSTGFTEIGHNVPFEPSQMDLILWLKAETLALADGAAVSTWADQSGKGHDATAAGGVRPLFQTDVTELNSYPVVQFDGTDDVMDGVFTEFLAIEDQVNIFCVAKLTATDLVRGIIDVSVNVVDEGTALFVNANTMKTRRGTAANEETAAFVETTKYHVISATSTNALRQLFLDGVSQNSSAVNKSMVTIPTAYALGARFGGGTMAGFIAEIIVSRTGWEKRAQIEKYFSMKYSLPVT